MVDVQIIDTHTHTKIEFISIIIIQYYWRKGKLIAKLINEIGNYVNKVFGSNRNSGISRFFEPFYFGSEEKFVFFQTPILYFRRSQFIFESTCKRNYSKILLFQFYFLNLI